MVLMVDWLMTAVWLDSKELRKRIRRCRAMTGGVETLRRASVQGVELQRKDYECIVALETTTMKKAMLVGEEMRNGLKCEGSGGLFFRFKPDLDRCRMPAKANKDHKGVTLVAEFRAVSAAHKTVFSFSRLSSTQNTDFSRWGTTCVVGSSTQVHAAACSLAPSSSFTTY